MPWIIISGFYLGNGGEKPLDESCGSSLLTKDGKVVGLFLLLTQSEKAYCVAAETLNIFLYELKQC